MIAYLPSPDSTAVQLALAAPDAMQLQSLANQSYLMPYQPPDKSMPPTRRSYNSSFLTFDARVPTSTSTATAMRHNLAHMLCSWLVLLSAFLSFR